MTPAMISQAGLTAGVTNEKDPVKAITKLLTNIGKAADDTGHNPTHLDSLLNSIKAQAPALAQACVANTPAEPPKPKVDPKAAGDQSPATTLPARVGQFGHVPGAPDPLNVPGLPFPQTGSAYDEHTLVSNLGPIADASGMPVSGVSSPEQTHAAIQAAAGPNLAGVVQPVQDIANVTEEQSAAADKKAKSDEKAAKASDDKAEKDKSDKDKADKKK